jgi:UDP-glucuronate decarboxylase
MSSFKAVDSVLIAGGAGFLGSHLVDALLERGATVWVIDNEQTGHWDNLKAAQRLYGCKLVTLTHDITQPLPPDLPTFSHIANLACAASPRHYQANPVHTLLTNVQGTYHLLAKAEADRAVFFQASTSEVYGDPTISPQPELYWGNVNPIGPRSCYDEGKRAAETLCLDMHRQAGVTVKMARIFNTYGPRMAPDDGRVVSQFIVQALAGQPLTVFGTGDQTRSFCYVDDLIAGIVRLWLETPAEVTGPVNLGNCVEIPVKALAAFVQSLAPHSPGVVYKPLPVDDPQQRRPDLSTAFGVLDGWRPTIGWQDGVRRTYEYFAGQTNAGFIN